MYKINPLDEKLFQVQLENHLIFMQLLSSLTFCVLVFLGCIMPGSAVLFKEGGKYRKGRFSFVLSVDWEVVEGERYKY